MVNGWASFPLLMIAGVGLITTTRNPPAVS